MQLATIYNLLGSLYRNASRSELSILYYKEGLQVACTWLADGQFPFFEFLNYFDLPEEKKKGDYNTIGGMLLHEFNDIPVAGEKIIWDRRFIFEIVDMDGTRIDKVVIV